MNTAVNDGNHCPDTGGYQCTKRIQINITHGRGSPREFLMIFITESKAEADTYRKQKAPEFVYSQNCQGDVNTSSQCKVDGEVSQLSDIGIPVTAVWRVQNDKVFDSLT